MYVSGDDIHDRISRYHPGCARERTPLEDSDKSLGPDAASREALLSASASPLKRISALRLRSDRSKTASRPLSPAAGSLREAMVPIPLLQRLFYSFFAFPANADILYFLFLFVKSFFKKRYCRYISQRGFFYKKNLQFIEIWFIIYVRTRKRLAVRRWNTPRPYAECRNTQHSRMNHLRHDKHYTRPPVFFQEGASRYAWCVALEKRC